MVEMNASGPNKIVINGKTYEGGKHINGQCGQREGEAPDSVLSEWTGGSID